MASIDGVTMQNVCLSECRHYYFCMTTNFIDAGS